MSTIVLIVSIFALLMCSFLGSLFLIEFCFLILKRPVDWILRRNHR